MVRFLEVHVGDKASSDPALDPHVELLIWSFPRWLLVIRTEMNPSMPCRAPPRISTPACAGPTVGANCRGKVTVDVRRAGQIMRPLLRGGIEERFNIDMRLDDLPRFRPLF